jgi:magnesium chelatase subunit D
MIYIEKLKSELAKGKGVRIGHTSVVSRKVHTINPLNPEVVNIMTNTDAGRVFYHRCKDNEIIHIDLFHEIAKNNVRYLAENLIYSLSESKFSGLVNYIDIFTASGGGKLTGSLSYGLTESLIKSHLNHTHIAALISDEQIEAVFLLIKKIEENLTKQGIELRKVERIIHDIAAISEDLSPYVSDSDSFLKQNQTDGNYQKIYEEAVDMIQRYETLNEICEILDNIKDEKIVKASASEQEMKRRYCQFDKIIEDLEQKRFIDKKINKYILTRKGELLRKYIQMKYKELELILKKSIRTRQTKPGLIMPSTMAKPYWNTLGPEVSKPYCNEDWIEELDINSTIKNSLTRCYLDKTEFYIVEDDLVTLKRRKINRQDICILIDSSASMTGDRIKSAKYLAKYLVLKSDTRISVLAFQDKEVTIRVPFTKNFGVVDRGLNEIVSGGLTPLALALHQGLSYMNSMCSKNPLIILITDGIPTVSLWTSDPIKDAISAAKNMSKKGFEFCCIGLEPNKDCLRKVTKAAAGKLFIVNELDRDSLILATKKSGQLL